MKKILSKLTFAVAAFYTRKVLSRKFTSFGDKAFVLEPHTVEVCGANVTVGRFAHLISKKISPIEFTTWSNKQLDGHIDVGDYCLISPGVKIQSAKHISIGDSCMLGANVYISDCDWHGVYNRLRPFRCSKPISIKDNVWVGYGAIINKGVSIGENSVVAAGSVVVHNVPANTVVGGNPALPIKSLNPKRKMLKREYMFKP